MEGSAATVSNSIGDCFTARLNVCLKLHHLVEDVAGEKVVLHVGDLHSHRNAVVVGALL